MICGLSSIGMVATALGVILSVGFGGLIAICLIGLYRAMRDLQ